MLHIWFGLKKIEGGLSRVVGEDHLGSVGP